MRSAGINFGIPDSEYIVRVDDTGAATNCYNQDTDTEYIGGGGGGGGVGEEVTVTFVNNNPDTEYPAIYYNVETNGAVDALRVYNEKYYYDENEIAEIAGGGTTLERKYLKISEYFYVQINGTATASGNAEIVWLPDFEIHAAKISGDCTLTIPPQG